MRTFEESRPTAGKHTGQRETRNRSIHDLELIADLTVRAAHWARLGDLQRAANLRRLARAALEGATR